MMHKKIKTSLLTFFLFTAIVIAGSCYYDKSELLYPGSNQPANCDSVPAKFSDNVSPLILSNCATATCHDITAAGGLVLQNYTQVSGAKDRINTRVAVEKTMPPTGALLPAEINMIKCWIENGAPNN